MDRKARKRSLETMEKIMEASHPRRHIDDFDDLEESSHYAGGFMLADPFDTLLRELSEAYIRAAWQRVATVLEPYRIMPDDLSWGILSASVYAPDFPPLAPHHYVGWVSRSLYDFDEDSRYGEVNAALHVGQPALGCAFSYRSSKWRVAPEDTRLGLQLAEALISTAEATDWAPAVILREYGLSSGRKPHPDGPWIHVAQAIHQLDQSLLDDALAEARAQYSPSGYRVMVGGFAAYLHVSEFAGQLQLPEVPD